MCSTFSCSVIGFVKIFLLNWVMVGFKCKVLMFIATAVLILELQRSCVYNLASMSVCLLVCVHGDIIAPIRLNRFKCGFLNLKAECINVY